MSQITELQSWYLAQCDGDWEHQSGIRVGTLDNPGWAFDVDLSETSLNGRAFTEISYGVGVDADASGDEWLVCRIVDGKFEGRGAPEQLEEMISIFLSWANGAQV
jgi:hypothetical protein